MDGRAGGYIGQVRLGYDSWSVTVGGLEKLPVQLGQAQISWVGCETNPLNEVWQNRPAVTAQIFLFWMRI